VLYGGHEIEFLRFREIRKKNYFAKLVNFVSRIK
jgi:hypothetical protein